MKNFYKNKTISLSIFIILFFSSKLSADLADSLAIIKLSDDKTVPGCIVEIADKTMIITADKYLHSAEDLNINLLNISGTFCPKKIECSLSSGLSGFKVKKEAVKTLNVHKGEIPCYMKAVFFDRQSGTLKIKDCQRQGNKISLENLASENFSGVLFFSDNDEFVGAGIKHGFDNTPERWIGSSHSKNIPEKDFLLVVPNDKESWRTARWYDYKKQGNLIDEKKAFFDNYIYLLNYWTENPHLPIEIKPEAPRKLAELTESINETSADYQKIRWSASQKSFGTALASDKLKYKIHSIITKMKGNENNSLRELKQIHMAYSYGLAQETLKLLKAAKYIKLKRVKKTNELMEKNQINCFSSNPKDRLKKKNFDYGKEKLQFKIK